MKAIFQLIIGVTILTLGSCHTPDCKIARYEDYSMYLLAEDAIIPKLETDITFWAEKLEKHPEQFPYRLKLSSLHTQLFDRTGSIDHVIHAEDLLTEAYKATGSSDVAVLHALSRNYSTQHRFKEALTVLKQAENNGERLKDTQKMLFDVYLELGQFSEAESYLTKFRNLRDFDYLIRLSKWNDHKGDLTTAITVMEKALERAKEMKNTQLLQWAYTNLGDFYGHANEIEKSYACYLQALALDPNDAYAKKGIAWIAYSHENDIDAAKNILKAITAKSEVPDYLLLAAEIYEFSGESNRKSELYTQFLRETSKPKYNGMYNSYAAELFAEEFHDYAKSLALAEQEVHNRPTPQSYDLLAWAHFQAGNKEKALEIAKKYVAGKTQEPLVLYHLASIYKANHMDDAAQVILPDLYASSYELGPVLVDEISKL